MRQRLTSLRMKNDARGFSSSPITRHPSYFQERAARRETLGTIGFSSGTETHFPGCRLSRDIFRAETEQKLEPCGARLINVIPKTEIAKVQSQAGHKAKDIHFTFDLESIGSQ